MCILFDFYSIFKKLKFCRYFTLLFYVVENFMDEMIPAQGGLPTLLRQVADAPFTSKSHFGLLVGCLSYMGWGSPLESINGNCSYVGLSAINMEPYEYHCNSIETGFIFFVAIAVK